MGMFFQHDRPLIILFDSGASHDFMCYTCAKKAKLALVAMEAPYVISTLGNRVHADQIVWRPSGCIPHYIEWSRDRCHPRNELDEVAQGHTGHNHPFSPPELTHAWHGYSAPSCDLLY
jgi:hypothetical protein